MSLSQPVSKASLQRFPAYLRYLQGRKNLINISSSAIAEDLKLNSVLVRKDLAAVARAGGRPKTGYVVSELIEDLESYLGYNNVAEVALVGVGHLGTALLSYDGFANSGMDIVLAFDANPALVGQTVSGKKIFGMERMRELLKRMKLKIAIVTVPRDHAQNVCNYLIECGINAIWNFAPVHLEVPAGITVKNEDLSASLAILRKQLTENLQGQNN